MSNEFLIYDYLPVRVPDRTVIPEMVDARKDPFIRFHPVNTMVQGEVQRTDYYAGYDEPTRTPHTPVLFSEFQYFRDSMGFAWKRIEDVCWYHVDGTVSDFKKNRVKYYDDLASIQEGHRRRGNIVSGLLKPVLGMILATEGATQPAEQAALIQTGRDFMKLHQTSFNAFVGESHSQIYTDVSAATDTWLGNIIDGSGTTIRTYILGELNIWGI